MKEIPILFSSDMIKALLAGRKIMTRRVINPQPIIDTESGSVFDGKYRKQYSIHDWRNHFIDDWSRWMPEDMLWVRETWCMEFIDENLHGEKYSFKADGNELVTINDKSPWKPSIHMPKEASRIWLQVMNIKIERLQEISEDDAKAEGALPVECGPVACCKCGFSELWKTINGAESWQSNPWVWVIEFKVLSTTGKPAEDDPTVCGKCGHPFHMHVEEDGAPCPVY